MKKLLLCFLLLSAMQSFAQVEFSALPRKVFLTDSTMVLTLWDSTGTPTVDGWVGGRPIYIVNLNDTMRTNLASMAVMLDKDNSDSEGSVGFDVYENGSYSSTVHRLRDDGRIVAGNSSNNGEIQFNGSPGYTIVSQSANGLTLTENTTNGYFTFTADAALKVNTTDALSGLVITSTNSTSGPVFYLISDDPSPSNGETVGSIAWQGEDDGDNKETFAALNGTSDLITNSDESGKLTFVVYMDASSRDLLTLDGYNGSLDEGQITLNDEAQDVDILIEASGVDTALSIRSSDGQLITKGPFRSRGLNSGTGTQISHVAATDEIVIETSSKEYKKYVSTWNPPNRIMEFRPRRFTWNAKSAHPEKRDYGLIKEEVEKVMPELIEGNMWHYGKTITYLISVIQDLEQRVEKLEECECVEKKNGPYFVPDNRRW